MDYELAKTMPIPEWAPPDSRFWKLYINDFWLRGLQYSWINHSFSAEKDRNGRAHRMWDKRPSVRLQLPCVAADVIKNKLFAPHRFPHLMSDDPELRDSMKWLIRESQLDRKMLDAAYWGQAGAVGLTLKVVDEKPVAMIWKAKSCTPLMGEDDRLISLQVHYLVSGQHWMEMDPTIRTDVNGTKIDSQADYWYIRNFDIEGIYTMFPIPDKDWNPESGKADKLRIRKPLTHLYKEDGIELKFPLAHWIRNSAAGDDVDGRSTFGLALPNCIHVDYTLSQMGRGLNAAAQPTLVVKGKLLSSQNGNVNLGPTSMIQLEGDYKTGEVERSGASAEFLEMTGKGVEVGMDMWVKAVFHWTKEIMEVSTKDPDTISGAISGKALELINEPFVDAVAVEQLQYGNYGLLEIVKKLANMLRVLKHPRFIKFSEEQIDECELDFPDMYSASAEEAQPLVTAITTAVAGGLMDHKKGKVYLHGQLGTKMDAVEDDSEDSDKDAKESEAGRQMALEALGKAPKPEAEGTGSGVKPKPKAKAKSASK